MKKIIYDFYLTVLIPLSILAASGFIASLRGFWLARQSILVNEDYWLEKATAPGADDAVIAEAEKWRNETEGEKRRFRDLMRLSGAALLVFAIFIFLGNDWKIILIGLAWNVLGVASLIAAVISFAMAWHYAKNEKRLFFALAVGCLVLSAASGVYFVHQKWNTNRITCGGDCDDSDRDDEPVSLY